MAVLIDTHAFLWWALDLNRLSVAARSAISGSDRVLVSAATAIEISQKVRLGKLPAAVPIDDGFESVVEAWGFVGLSISLAHGRLAGALPGDHRDPFDRILAAQSIIEGLPIVSIDAALDGLGAIRIW